MVCSDFRGSEREEFLFYQFYYGNIIEQSLLLPAGFNSRIIYFNILLCLRNFRHFPLHELVEMLSTPTATTKPTPKLVKATTERIRKRICNEFCHPAGKTLFFYGNPCPDISNNSISNIPQLSSSAASSSLKNFSFRFSHFCG